MKNITKLATKAIVLSMILSSGVALAADGDYTNMTLDGRLYQYDTYGAQWALDTGSDGLWLVPKVPVGGTYSAPFKLRNGAADNTLVVGGNDEGTDSYIGIGTDTPVVKLDVQWSGSNTVDDGLTNLLLLSANNSDGTTSDAGFGLRNDKSDFQWNFRTGQNGEAFIATKAGNGGADFQVLSGASYTDAEMMVGGVTIFKNGQLVDGSGAPLALVIEKQNIVLAETQAALEAKDAEMIVMKAEANAKGQKIAMMEADAKTMKTEIAELKVMKQKVAMLESILTNLALNTSASDKSKVSINLK